MLVHHTPELRIWFVGLQTEDRVEEKKRNKEKGNNVSITIQSYKDVISYFYNFTMQKKTNKKVIN